MMTSGDGPFFNLKAVVQQTGLKPDTLRAWERRYGLPTPGRSSGGHRLYTRYDIETLKWLIARQQEGLSIARAVDLWRQLEGDGRDPLVSPGVAIASTPPAEVSRAQGQTLTELREDWISACLGYDEQRSEQVLVQAFALYPPEMVVVQLLQASMSQIGDKWYRGEVTVQQEHFCSALANRRLDALLMASPPATRPGRVLTACPPHERHTFSLLLLTFLLRRRGWDVIYLGADVPVERLETTVAVTGPQLVIMAAQRLHSAASLLDAAELLQVEGIPLAYGGLVFNLLPEVRARVPGHFLGERLDLAPEAAESLITAPHAVPSAVPSAEVFQAAIAHFREQQGLIEADLVKAMDPAVVEPRYLAIANQELARDITAALTLGDLELLGKDLEWLRGLLDNNQMPAAILYEYLTSYHDAARKNLDGRGAPLVEWLGTVIEENGFGRGNSEDSS